MGFSNREKSMEKTTMNEEVALCYHSDIGDGNNLIPEFFYISEMDRQKKGCLSLATRTRRNMGESTQKQLLRQIPGVDVLLQVSLIQELLSHHPRKLVMEAIREVLDETRRRILGKDPSCTSVDSRVLAGTIAEKVEILASFTLRPVVNATGIVIHTNLGRSLLPESAISRLQVICGSYNNLEYDLGQGKRGSRYVHAEAILKELTGAEAALVVNNNAGAVLLVLSTLAKGREVVVSRGELVEIGGSFRIPDVMSSSGAILREVGSTNRTHLRDYVSAICESTALLMKVHTSNYRIVGFTAAVSLEELVVLGREHGLPVIEDLGSGCFINLTPFGLQGETLVQDSIRSGVDLVTFSGDKLLGGPQAGIIVGRKDLVEQCRKNPITRALRVDKMSLAALESTLRLYRDERQALEHIPTLRMISVSAAELEMQARDLAGTIKSVDVGGLLKIEVRQGSSQVGGGSLPAQDLPTWVVAIQSKSVGPNSIEDQLRTYDVPVIGRIESDFFIMDLRTIKQSQFETIRQAFERMLSASDKKKTRRRSRTERQVS